MIKIKVFTFFLLVAFFFTACSADVPKGTIVMPLVSDDPGSRPVSVAIAVEADGDKHIAWSECPAIGWCRVIYQRTRSGEIGPQLIFSNPSLSYSAVSIVALNDGRAVLGFLQSNGPNCNPRYVVIPDNILSTPAINLLIPGDTTNSSCSKGPRIVSNGSTVYAVVDKIHSSRLVSYQYRKLLPSLDAGVSIVVPANLSYYYDLNDNLVAEVDSSGTLHTAWTSQRKATAPESNTYAVEYANNNGVSGTLTPVSLISGSTWVGNIDIAAQSAIKARVVYALDTTPDRSVWVATVSSGVISQLQINLTPNQGWIQLYPKITNYGDTSDQVVVFRAEKDDLSNAEVFYKIVNPAGSAIQITNSSSNYRDSGLNDLITFDGGFLAGITTYSSSGLCGHDVSYTFSAVPPTTLFNSPISGCVQLTGAVRLASAGPWIAGIWIHRLSADSERMVPWISFNTNTIHLPIITR